MYPSLPVCFSGAFRASSTGSGQASSRPRELHSRLTFPRRLAAGPALPSLSPRRAVRPAPGLRAAAWLFAAALVLPGALLLSTGEAQAQSTVKLVGTTGQTENTSSTQSRFINDRAQAFTTGSSPNGYTLKRIDLPMSWNAHTSPTPPTYTVKIHNATSSGPGGTVLGTLTNPASVIEGTNSYTSAGIDLEANTTYFVFIDVTGQTGNHHRISNDITDSDNEDLAKSAGWSVANGSLTRQFEASSWDSRTFSWKMAIRGVVKRPAPAPAPGALVGNTGQTPKSTPDDFTFDHAQPFTTGSNSGGYRLTGVDLRLSHASGTLPTYTVSIHRDSSDEPGSALGTLTNPASLPSSVSNVRYTAPGAGITLAANTKYWVVIDVSTTSSTTTLQRTNSDAEDSGAAAGWSIGNQHEARVASGTTWGSTNDALLIAIHGSTWGSRVPPKPAAPTLSKTNGTSLTVRWTAVAGSPDDYDVRYRRKGDTSWTDHPHDGTALSTTITGVLQGASWEAQVAASNAVGPGQWSDIGAGHTGPARFVSAEVDPSGLGIFIYFTKPIKHSGTFVDFSFRRDGSPSNATSVSHAGGIFGLSTGSANAVQAGQTVSVSYLKPSSGSRLEDADSLLVDSFTNEPATNLVPSAPAAPAAPTVSSVAGERALSVSWTAPAANAAITDYDLRYFAGSADPTDANDWIEAGETGGHDHVGAATSAKITGLTGATAYRVQVRAENSAGEGGWSPSGSTSTASTVPNAPAAPTVSLSSSNGRSLDVSWTAPATGGSAITGYELRYFKGSSDPSDEDDWVINHLSSGIPDPGTSTSATISGLLGSTTYQVQVRATNANGDGPWSASGSAGTSLFTGTNQAPIRMQLGTSNNCVQKTANTVFQRKNSTPSGGLVSAFPILGGTCSGANRVAPMFSDPDGDTLVITAKVRNLPDNVVLEDGMPWVNAVQGRVFFQGYAAHSQTVVTVDVTATDPRGASISTFFEVQLNALLNDNGAPSFESQVNPLQFALNKAIEPVILPAATGGDTAVGLFGHTYEVEGLPDGLTFDAATRTVSGTPTKTGLFVVTYRAGDADNARGGGRQGGTENPDGGRDRAAHHPGADRLEADLRFGQRRHGRHLRRGRQGPRRRGVQRAGEGERHQEQRERAPGPGGRQQAAARHPEDSQGEQQQPAPRRRDAALHLHGGRRRHRYRRVVCDFRR